MKPNRRNVRGTRGNSPYHSNSRGLSQTLGHRRYNSINEVKYIKQKDPRRSNSPHNRTTNNSISKKRRRPSKSSYESNKMKKSYSNYDFEKFRNSGISSTYSSKPRPHRGSQVRRGNLFGTMGNPNHNYGRKHRHSRNNSEYNSTYSRGRGKSSVNMAEGYNTVSMHAPGKKAHKKTNSLKSDLLSKYLKAKMHSSQAENLNISLDSNLNASRDSRGKSSYSRKGGMSNSKIMARKNLKESIMKKYRTVDKNNGGAHYGNNHHSHSSGIKSSTIYQKSMKRKLMGNSTQGSSGAERGHPGGGGGRAGHRSNWVSNNPSEKGSYQKPSRKARTLSSNKSKMVSASFDKRKNTTGQIKRIRSGMIHKSADESRYYSSSKLFNQSTSSQLSRSRKRRESTSKERRRHRKTSSKKNHASRTNFNSTSYASNGSRKSVSSKKGYGSRSKKSASGAKSKMSNSISQIRISEFESNMSQYKRNKVRAKKKTLVFPHLESIQKAAKRLPPFEKSKVIIKNFGNIHSFSVNTHQGTVRNYNEDRVSILLNAQQR